MGVYDKGTLCNQIFISALQPGGAVGVAIFFLISGYFLIEKENGSFSKVISRGIFYGLLCGAIVFVLKIIHIIDYISFGEIMRTILVGVSNGSVWWFLTVYMYLMIMTPFLNKFALELSPKMYAYTLIIIWIFPYSLDILFDGMYTSLAKGIFYYLLGGYIRKYYIKRIWKWIKLQLLGIFIISWAAYMMTNFIINGNILFSTYATLVSRLGNTVGESVFTLFCSVSLFLLFCQLDFYSPFINIIASTTFGWYLISDAPILRMFIWEKIWHSQNMYMKEFFIPKAMFIIVITCALCGIIDYFRKIIIEPQIKAFSDSLFVKISK